MFEELIARIAGELKKADLPYMIIGGQAVLLYGSPRMTKDIDITLGLHAESQGVEGIGSVRPEQRILEFRRTVLGLKYQPEGILLGQTEAAKGSALDANSRIDLKPFGAVRMDQLERRRTLPPLTRARRVAVDPVRAEHVVDVHHNGQRGN